MASQPRFSSASSTAEDVSTPIEVQKKQHDLGDRANNAIAERAYALYLAGGGAHGRDMTDWLQAESEILRRVPEVRESASWYTVNAPLPGFSPDQIQVGVDANRALVVANRTQSSPGDQDTGGTTTEESIFLVADWPSEVDPESASAYVKNDNLTLTVKRATAARAATAD